VTAGALSSEVVVLDQQHVDDPELGRICGVADLRHIPLPVTT
jgi:hypothetical protein